MVVPTDRTIRPAINAIRRTSFIVFSPAAAIDTLLLRHAGELYSLGSSEIHCLAI
jgi:hypothetical protein